MMSNMMSSILGKTLDQTVSLIRGTSSLRTTAEVRLDNLHDAIIGTSRTMQMKEYKQTIEKCSGLIRKRLQELHLSSAEKREYILMIIHLCNLNEKLPAVHPFVIKYIEDSRMLLDKKLGYLALTIMSKIQEPCVYLAVNTIMKDLSSRSSSVICIALGSLASVIDVDLIPVFLPTMEKLLKTGVSSVKCKVLTVLHTMVIIGLEYLLSIWDDLVQSLCDRDPHVMNSSLPVIVTLVQKSPPPKELKLHEKVIFILKQVEQGCLPIDMMHAGISGPWIQIRLLYIVRNLPHDRFEDSNIVNLRDIIQRIFVRFQHSNYLHVAIVVEGIQTIVAFHPRLECLEEKLVIVIEKILSSSNPNILHCGVSMLKVMTTIKPGFTKRYANTLLKAASDQNPSTMRLILELVDDFTGSEHSEEILSTLVKKLKKESDSTFRKEIFSSLLTLLKKFPMKYDWILDNYLSWLSCLRNDLDFTLLKKLVQLLHSVPEELMQKEAKRLAKSLKRKFSAMQYCTILEILSLYHKSIPRDECQTAANDIMDNCRRIIWQTHHEEILSISWSTVVYLTVEHDMTVDGTKFEKSSYDTQSIMLLQQRGEIQNLIEDGDFSKFVVNIGLTNERKMDSNLAFLDHYTQSHSTNSNEQEPVHSVTMSIPIKEQPASAFKTVPYSRSRFDVSKAPINEETKPRKQFLDVPTSANGTPSTVWDSKNYSLDSDTEKFQENT